MSRGRTGYWVLVAATLGALIGLRAALGVGLFSLLVWTYNIGHLIKTEQFFAQSRGRARSPVLAFAFLTAVLFVPSASLHPGFVLVIALLLAAGLLVTAVVDFSGHGMNRLIQKRSELPGRASMRFIRFAILSSLLFQAPVGPVVAQVAQSSLPEQTTVLRMSANLTLVDVTVTSRSMAVQGLHRQQFHIFEDGKEQRVLAFDEHRNELTAVQDATHLPLLAHAYTNVPARESPGSQNVFLFDELNTPVEATDFLRQQVLEYFSRMKPGTSIAVFVLGSRLRLLQGFTTDPVRLAQSLRNESPDPVSLAQSRASGAITSVAARQLASYLKDIPGRKNVVWFAGGFPVAFDPGGAFSAAHATIYPVDARGLVVSPLYGAEYADWGVAKRASADFMESLAADHTGMMQLAEQTGGRAFVDTNGLRDAIASAVETGSEYYTISYAPPANLHAGEPRRIKVTLEGGSGYKLDYRRSYFAPNDGVGIEMQHPPDRLKSATLLGAPPESGILFEARVLPATAP